MRKLFIITTLLFSFSSFAQDAITKEPDFVGEGFVLTEAQGFMPLEKNKVNIETRMKFSAVGLNMVVNGCCSNVLLKPGTIKLVIKVENNAISPSSALEVFRLNSYTKNRSVEYMKLGNGGRVKEGTKMETLSFTASKYGTSSYLLTLTGVQEGEYGIALESEKKSIGGGGLLNNVIGPTSILTFKVK
jgi:hypothetical protein